MHKAILQHIEQIVKLEPSEIDILESCLNSSTIKKKELILEEGQVCNTLYFIIKGCM